jgi:hypothetical protein
MEAFMKTLCSVMALAIALATSGAWSSVAEAQSKQSTARKSATTQQKPAPRRTKAVAKAKPVQRAVQKPCARYTWWGCVGWDPDPNVRDALAREVGDDDS